MRSGEQRSRLLREIAHPSQSCRRFMTIPGVGAQTSAALPPPSMKSAASDNRAPPLALGRARQAASAATIRSWCCFLASERMTDHALDQHLAQRSASTLRDIRHSTGGRDPAMRSKSRFFPKVAAFRTAATSAVAFNATMPEIPLSDGTDGRSWSWLRTPRQMRYCGGPVLPSGCAYVQTGTSRASSTC